MGDATLKLDGTLVGDAGALADLAFGTLASQDAAGQRGLAYLSNETLFLDLDDPEQRELGDYELIRMLGEGGMGVVYLARQRSLDREVALKLLSVGPWSSQKFVDRFRDEAQSAARLQHPNIVPIFEIGSWDELNFFSMAVVHGPTLDQVLKRDGPMDPVKAARLVRVIAEAVDYAHRMGVLHLDLKPGNVLLDERGEPMVADFGLARRLDESRESIVEEVAGTPSYMAPEQALPGAAPLSPVTDVYGLGAILYELLAGVTPFRGRSAEATLAMVQSREPAPPVRHHKRSVPADISAICEKCLAKSGEDRYPSARALADDLERFLDNRPVSVRPLSLPQKVLRAARREPRVAAAVTAAVMALALGLAATSVQWQRAETSAEATRNLLWESRRAQATELAEQGKGFEAADLLIRNIEEGGLSQDRRRAGILLADAPVLIDSIQLDGSPVSAALSPDGRTLAVGSKDLSVRWFSTRDLEEQGSVDLGEFLGYSEYHRQPKLIEFVGNEKLLVTLNWVSDFVSPSGTSMHLVDLIQNEVVVPPGLDEETNMTFSPDANFAVVREGGERMRLWRVAEPYEEWEPISDSVPALSPEISWLMGRDARFAFQLDSGMVLWGYSPDPARLGETERPDLPFLRNITAWATGNVSDLTAFGDMEGRVHLVDVATLESYPLPTPRGEQVKWLAFSEDDRLLAVGNRDGTVHAFSLRPYAFSTALGAVAPLASGTMRHDFEVQRVRISRKHRLLMASGQGQTALWRLPEPSGYPKEAVRIASSPSPWPALSGAYAVDWAPDAGLLAGVGSDGMVRLWRIPESPMRNARPARQIARGLQFDGRHLVDVTNRQVRVVDARLGTPITDWVRLPEPPGFAELTNQGRTLVVSSGPALYVYDLPRMRLRFPPIELHSSPLRMAMHPEGQRVLVSLGNSGEGLFEEHLLIIDLAAGTRLTEPVKLAGPLRQVEYTSDGQLIMAIGTAPAQLDVLEAGTLERLTRIHADAGRQIGGATIMGDRIVLSQYGGVDTPDELLYWNRSTEELDNRLIMSDLQSHELGNLGGRLALFGALADYLQFDDRTVLRLDREGRERAVPAFTVSNGGALMARALRGSFQLFDRDGRSLGNPLSSEISGHDVIAALTYSPDDQSLLARTALGRWLLWDIGLETRSPAELAQQMDRMRLQGQPTANARYLMRSSDPGRWAEAPARPGPEVLAAAPAGGWIPIRSAGANPLMLDLAPHFFMSPESRAHELIAPVMDLSGLPLGVQRIDGVDFDIRGAIAFEGAEEYYTERGIAAGGRSLVGIEVPAVPVAAFHLLLFANIVNPDPVPEEKLYATIRLNYADGSEASIPLRTQREVPGWSAADDPVPFGWALTTAGTYVWDGYQDLLSNPRISNPHPDWLVATLDIEIGSEVNASPLIFAITAEPVDPDLAPGSLLKPGADAGAD